MASGVVVTAKELFEKYKKFVENNVETVGHLESAARILSYIVPGIMFCDALEKKMGDILDKMSSQMLYGYILRRTQIVSTAKRHKQRQLTSRKTRSNAYIQCIYIYSKQSR